MILFREKVFLWGVAFSPKKDLRCPSYQVLDIPRAEEVDLTDACPVARRAHLVASGIGGQEEHQKGREDLHFPLHHGRKARHQQLSDNSGRISLEIMLHLGNVVTGTSVYFISDLARQKIIPIPYDKEIKGIYVR